MDPSNRVSVVIPTYNRARYLKECLQSVFAQTIAPYEVIVVDDGSTDATSDIIASLGNPIRYLRKENAGKPRALNFALPHVRGDFVWLFDDDDVAMEDSIEKRLDVLRRNPDVGFVLSGHYLGEDGPGGEIRRGREYRLPDIPAPELWLALMKGCFATMQSMLVRAELLRRAGPFDHELVTSEDYDMMLRLAAQIPYALLREPTFIFRQHHGLRGPEHSRFEAAGRQQIFRKYDAVVGRKLRAALPLGAFLVPPAADGSLERPRQITAIRTRMEVMGSKGLVAEMFEDLAAALQLADACGLEIRPIGESLRAAVCTGYAYDAISEDFSGVLAHVETIRRQAGGRSALVHLALGLLRLAKSYPGSLRERSRKVLLAIAVLWRLLPRTGSRNALSSER